MRAIAIAAMLLLVGCSTQRDREFENLRYAAERECMAKGGVWLDVGNGYPPPRTCFRVDSVIPIATPQQLPKP